jgi:hypothetical protein
MDHPLETRVALIENNYGHLERKIDEHHADTRKAVDDLTTEFRAMREMMSNQQHVNKQRAAMWTTIRHAATALVSIAGSVYAAKALHVPIEVGDAANHVGKHLS